MSESLQHLSRELHHLVLKNELKSVSNSSSMVPSSSHAACRRSQVRAIFHRLSALPASALQGGAVACSMQAGVTSCIDAFLWPTARRKLWLGQIRKSRYAFLCVCPTVAVSCCCLFLVLSAPEEDLSLGCQARYLLAAVWW